MNGKRFIIILTTFPLILTLATCQKNTVPEIEIVAKVENEYLTREDLFNWMPDQVSEEQKKLLARQYIDRWVEKTTMALSAKNNGISLSSYEKWSLSNYEKELLAQKYLETKLPKNIIITDEEISTFYEENKKQFIRQEDEVHLIHLFLENQDKAIAAEMKELKSLLEVIKKNYLDTQFNRLLEKNGDLGYIPVSKLRKEITKLVKTGNTGRIYGPIRIEKGYYYFQMMDKQKAGSYRSLDLVKEEIRLRLTAIKRNNIANELGKKLTEKYIVKIFMEHIK